MKKKKQSKIDAIQKVIDKGLTDEAKAQLRGVRRGSRDMSGITKNNMPSSGPAGRFASNMPTFGGGNPLLPLSQYSTPTITLNEKMPETMEDTIVLTHEELHALDKNTYRGPKVNMLANSKGFAAALKAADPEAYQRLLAHLNRTGYGKDPRTLDVEMFAYYGEGGTGVLLTNPAIAKFYANIYKPMSFDTTIKDIPTSQAGRDALEKIYKNNLLFRLDSLTKVTEKAIQKALASGNQKEVERIQSNAENTAIKIKIEEFENFKKAIIKAKPIAPNIQNAAMQLLGSDNSTSQSIMKRILEREGVNTKGMFPEIEKQEAEMKKNEETLLKLRNTPVKKTTASEANVMIQEMLKAQARKQAIEDTGKPVKITGLPEESQYQYLSSKGGGVKTNNPAIQSVVDGVLRVVPANMKEAAQTAIPLIIEALEERGILTPNVLAYALATVQHESGFRPIGEIQGEQQAAKLGYDGGAKYMGRGYVQLTGEYNYKKIGDAIGVDLVNNPTALLNPAVSAKALAAYFDLYGTAKAAETGDFVEARRTVNGGEFNIGSTVPYNIASYAQSYKSKLPDKLSTIVKDSAATLKNTVQKSKQNIFDPISDMIQKTLGGIQSVFVPAAQATSARLPAIQKTVTSTPSVTPTRSTSGFASGMSTPARGTPAPSSGGRSWGSAPTPAPRPTPAPAPRSTPAAANMSTNRGPAVSSQVYRPSAPAPRPTPAPSRPAPKPAPKPAAKAPSKPTPVQQVFKAVQKLFTWGR